MDNVLYYGDNLDVLRRYVADESVDLVYLDPPFNSAQNYNVLFAEQDGSRAASQIKAFEDTWRWDQSAAAAFEAVVTAGGKVSEVMQAFRIVLGESDMMAYLAMMAPRLVELRRVLKPTGSIYLHCDQTASHYLKLLMDAVFGTQNFRSEINWIRTNAHNLKARYFQRVSDIILFYTFSEKYTWNEQHQPYSEQQLKRYRLEPETGRYYTGQDLTLMGTSPARQFEWRGTKPPANRVWGMSIESLESLWAKDLILRKTDGTPRLDGRKVYLDEKPGKSVTAVWDDISRVGNTSMERLGYPTQKPETLLERIILASSNPGDVVLDPFCGCGTAVTSAQKLDRRWVGIDITHLAITLIKERMKNAFGSKAVFQVVGEPVSVQDAAALAASDPYQFQWWALGLAGARPAEQKKGADKGVDGRLYFIDDASGKARQVVFSVKAGHTNVAHVRDLRGVVDRDSAAIGVLITMEEPSKPMRAEAASAGFYESPGWGKKYRRLQIRTVGELLEGKGVEMPPPHQASVTFKKARKKKEGAIEPPDMMGDQ